MKTKIYILIILMCTGYNISAQSYYEGNTAKGNGITYICDHKVLSYVEIYLNTNQFHNVEMTYKDGRSIRQSVDDILSPADEIVTMQNPDVEDKILKEVFGTTLLKSFKETEEFLIVSHTIDWNGNITEISFGFDKDDNLVKVSPDTYYQLEQKMKSRLKYKVHEEAKKYNIIKVDYAIRFWDL